MEDVLHLYSLPYDAEHPVVCFDERPCVLHSEVAEPLPMKEGQSLREDYEYKREGTCSLLLAFEPLTGFRIAEVSQQRTAEDYTRFMRKVAEHYAGAQRIRLVQDNLNTHTAGSFYGSLPAPEAFALAERFEMHYTPKKGSWLNMAELEIGVIVRQCLDRRLASRQQTSDEVEALVKERNREEASVTWQFTPELAREKLKRHYQRVFHKN